MLFFRKTGSILKNTNIKKEFPLFILAGSIAALINVISRIILTIFLNFEISVFISYLIAMVSSFLLQRKIYLHKNLIDSFLEIFQNLKPGS